MERITLLNKYMKTKHLLLLFIICLYSCKNKKIEKYSNGNVIEEVELNDQGQRHGKKIGYFENGNIKIEATFNNDSLSGHYVDYYENGNKRRECNYENGAINGNYTDYYVTSQLNSKIEFKDGHYDGEALFYYTGGSLKTKALFENGKYLYYTKYDSIGNVTDKDFFVQITILNKLSQKDSVRIKTKIYGFINNEKEPINTAFYKLPITNGVSVQSMRFENSDSCYYYTFKPPEDTGKFNIGVRLILEHKFSIRADSIVSIKE